MQAKLVGGSHDGESVEISKSLWDSGRLNLPVQGRGSVSTYDIESYHRVEIVVDRSPFVDRRFCIWVVDGMSDEAALEKFLIDS